MGEKVPEEIEEREEVDVKKHDIWTIALVVACVFFMITSYVLWTSYIVAKQVAGRTSSGEIKEFESEKKAVAIVPMVSAAKDNSYMVYIKKGVEQSNLSLQVQFQVAVSSTEISPVFEDQAKVAPIVDRVLAYFSEKTKSDIIYLFQRKSLGEEIKEIINAILEKDMDFKEEQGRVTQVHITKLLFMAV